MELVTKHFIKEFDIGTNNYLYGGRMLDWLDETGYMYLAEKFPTCNFVTLKISETIFHKPGHIGDIISFYVDECKQGKSSITLTIKVQRKNEIVLTTNMVFVNVGKDGHSKIIN